MSFLGANGRADEGKIRLLIVEDSDEDFDLLVHVFRSTVQRAEVKRAKSLGDGVDQFRVFRPDVVLLDLNLPDSQGADTVRAFEARCPEARIIVVSGHVGDVPGLGARAVQKGTADDLGKALAVAVATFAADSVVSDSVKVSQDAVPPPPSAASSFWDAAALWDKRLTPFKWVLAAGFVAVAGWVATSIEGWAQKQASVVVRKATDAHKEHHDEEAAQMQTALTAILNKLNAIQLSQEKAAEAAVKAETAEAILLCRSLPKAKVKHGVCKLRGGRLIKLVDIDALRLEVQGL